MVDVRSAAWLTAFLALAALMLTLSPLPLAGDLERRAGALVVPAGAALHDFTRPATDLLLNAGELRAMSEENAALRTRVARLEAEAAALREANVAVAQAAALVDAVGGAAGSGTGHHVAASVLLRDPSAVRRAITVDRGLDAGVTPGQPVLGPGATLVGIVTDVTRDRARVRLLSDAASAVTAVVQESRAPGALAGGADGLRLEFVPVGANITVGDLVLTSALGGRLPRGLLIGRVTAVHSDGQDLFETVEVEPLTDYARLEQVLILVGFAPGAAIDERPP